MKFIRIAASVLLLVSAQAFAAQCPFPVGEEVRSCYPKRYFGGVVKCLEDGNVLVRLERYGEMLYKKNGDKWSADPFIDSGGGSTSLMQLDVTFPRVNGEAELEVAIRSKFTLQRLRKIEDFDHLEWSIATLWNTKPSNCQAGSSLDD